MNVFQRHRSYSPGDVITIHTKAGTSVQGAFVRRSKREWVLTKHSIEADGVYIESRMDRVCVPVECIEIIEVRDR